MKPQFQSSSRVQQPWAEHRALTDKTLREGGLGSAWEYLAGQEGLGCTFTSPHLGFFPLSSLREEQDLAVVSKGSAMSTQDRARPWQRHRAHSGHGEPWVFNLLKSLYFHQLFVQTYSSGRCWVQPWATIPEILNQRSHNGKNKQDPLNSFLFCLLWKGTSIKISCSLRGNWEWKVAGHGVVTLPGLQGVQICQRNVPAGKSGNGEQSAVLHCFVCQYLGIQGWGCAFQGGAGICSLWGIPKVIPSLFWNTTTGTQHWGLSEDSSLPLFGAELRENHPGSSSSWGG